MESPINASKARQMKGQSCKFLTLLLHLFPKLHQGHYGHGLIQPHSFPFHCAFPQGCAHISDSSHSWSSVSVERKTPGGRREARWETTSKHQDSQAPAGVKHRLGQQLSHRVLRWCSHRIHYACTYFILFFIATVANTSGISLGPPVAQCLYLPITLASFLCIYLNIFF